MFASKLGFVVTLGNPNWNLWVGKAGPKTRPIGGFGLAQKGNPKESKMEPKWSQHGSKNGTKTKPLGVAEKLQKPFEFLGKSSIILKQMSKCQNVKNVKILKM